MSAVLLASVAASAAAEVDSFVLLSRVTATPDIGSLSSTHHVVVHGQNSHPTVPLLVAFDSSRSTAPAEIQTLAPFTSEGPVLASGLIADEPGLAALIELLSELGGPTSSAYANRLLAFSLDPGGDELARPLALLLSLSAALSARDYALAEQIDSDGASIACGVLCARFLRLRGIHKLQRYGASAEDRGVAAKAFSDALGALESGNTLEPERAALEAMLRADLAFARALDGEVTKALEELDSALVAAGDGPHPAVVEVFGARMASVYFVLGELAAEDPHPMVLSGLYLALDAASALGDRFSEVEAMLNLGTQWAEQGAFDTATATYAAAVLLAEQEGFSDLASMASGLLSAIFVELGDDPMAVSFATHAIEMENRDERRARLMNARGRALRRLGLFVRAAADHEAALSFYSRAKDPSGIVAATVELAADDASAGACAAALDRLDTLATTHPEDLEGDAAGRYLNVRAHCLMETAEGLVVLEQLREARQERMNAKVPGDAAVGVELDLRLIEALIANGEEQEALSVGREAVELVDSVMVRTEARRLGPAWADLTAPLYQRTASLLLREHYRSGSDTSLAEAFDLIESARGRSLISQRRAARVARDRTSDAVDQTLRELSAKASLVVERARAGEASLTDRIDDYLVVSGNRLLRTRVEVQSAGDRLLGKVQSALRHDEAFVSLFCDERHDCHSIVVDEASMRASRLGETQGFARAAESAVRAVSRGRRSRVERTWRPLAEALFSGGWAERLPGRVFVSADAPLDRIPLEALSLPGVSERLGVSREVVRTIAVAELVSQRDDPGNETGTTSYAVDLAVFADPQFNAPSNAAMTRGTTPGRTHEWPRLAGTALEADALMRMYAGDQVLFRTGVEATASALLAPEFLAARIIHIASHAYFDDRAMDVPGIVAAAEPTDTMPRIVTPDALAERSVAAELVVIAACETDLGRYRWGEGRMSMARSFLAQGARQVVSTLWPVSDAGAAAFMLEFHAGLQGGLSAPAALAAARREMIEDSRYAHPYFWGAYTLQAAY